MQLGVYGFFVLVVAGIVLLFWTGRPTLPSTLTWLQLGGTIAAGVCAYYALTAAMRTGEISIVAPFRYTRLVFAMTLGVLVFAERPDSMTLLGSGIIVLSGFYTVLRERRQNRIKA